MMNPHSSSFTSSPRPRCVSASSSLLTLPLEIRLVVLSYLLVSPHPLCPCTHYTLSSQVLQVCHTICTEGTSLLYESNHFDLQTTSTIFAFANQIGPINCSLIRHLSLALYADSLYSLTEFTGLKTLNLYFQSYMELGGMEKEVRESIEEFVHVDTEIACLARQKQEVKCLLVWRYTTLMPKTRPKTAVYNINTGELELLEDSYLSATLKELIL